MKKWKLEDFQREDGKEKFFWDRFCDLAKNRYDIIEMLYKFSMTQKQQPTLDIAADIEPEIQYLLDLLESNREEMKQLNQYTIERSNTDEID